MMIVRGARIVLPDGERPASLHIQDGRIVAVRAYDDVPVGEADLRRAMPILARRRVPLLVHAESPRYIDDCRLTIDDRNLNPQSSILSRQSYSGYLATRPPQAEVEAVRSMIDLAAEFGV